jgi:hypothetical protein
MLLLELAAQGVRGFSPSARMQFKAGYNALVPPQGVASGLVPLLVALLYGDGRGGDGALAASAGARAGLSLQARDGSTYRLMRVLGSGGALHRLEAGGRWSVISQDSVEIATALRGALGLPSRGQFESLFCFDSQMLPSKRPAPIPRLGTPGPGALQRPAPEVRALRPNALVEAAMASAASTRSRPRDAERSRQELERLRREVAVGKATDEVQYKLEGLQQKLFDLDQKLKELERFRAEAQAARAAIEGAPGLEALNLPEDALERAARFDEARQRRDEALEKLRVEQRAAQEASQVPPQPLWRARRFPLAVGTGAAMLAVAAVFRGSPWGYLGLLGIPVFGYAGMVALEWIGELQAYDGLGRKQSIVRDREQKIEAAFESEYLPIKAAMKLLGVERGADLLEHFERRAAAESAARAAEARLAAAEADPETASLRSRQAQLRAEVEALDAKLGGLGASATRDWREAEREIAEIERALSAPFASAAPPIASEPAPSNAADSIGAAAGSGAGALRGDPGPGLLGLAEDLFPGLSLGALAEGLRERAGQYFAALTEQRFSGLELDDRARVQVLAPGRAIPAGALDDGELDLLYLALKLSLVERAAAAGKIALLLNEPFAALPAPVQQVLSRSLKLIASQTQVVHATALPANLTAADAVVRG